MFSLIIEFPVVIYQNLEIALSDSWTQRIVLAWIADFASQTAEKEKPGSENCCVLGVLHVPAMSSNAGVKLQHDKTNKIHRYNDNKTIGSWCYTQDHTAETTSSRGTRRTRSGIWFPISGAETKTGRVTILNSSL
jgi:hypothetical protein